MIEFFSNVITNAVGSFFGGMFVVWLALGTTGFKNLRSRNQRPRIMSTTRKTPEDILFGIELGTPEWVVRELLGAPTRVGTKWWGYRFVDGLVSIHFSDVQSVKEIALASTTTDTTFYFPWFEDSPPLGELTLDRVIFEDTELKFSGSRRHQQVATYTRTGPQGAWVNYTFGALDSNAPGTLASTSFEWDQETKILISPPNKVRINWIGISSSIGPAYFPIDLGLANVGI